MGSIGSTTESWAEWWWLNALIRTLFIEQVFCTGEVLYRGWWFIPLQWSHFQWNRLNIINPKVISDSSCVTATTTSSVILVMSSHTEIFGCNAMWSHIHENSGGFCCLFQYRLHPIWQESLYYLQCMNYAIFYMTVWEYILLKTFTTLSLYQNLHWASLCLCT